MMLQKISKIKVSLQKKVFKRAKTTAGILSILQPALPSSFYRLTELEALQPSTSLLLAMAV